jgi:hypothetical protein
MFFLEKCNVVIDRLRCYFESVEKVAKKRKSDRKIGVLFFYYCVQKFSTYTFLFVTFLHLFYEFQLSIKFCF